MGHEQLIKRNIGTDLRHIMSHFLDDHNSDYTEDEIYVGKVVDNNDPEKLGRCKILVYSVFGETTPPAQLPWAVPEFGFVGSLKGSFIVPRIGTFVSVRFDSGEINLPIYSTKVMNTNQFPTNKDKNYPNNLVFFETDNGDKAEIDLVDRTACTCGPNQSS